MGFASVQRVVTLSGAPAQTTAISTILSSLCLCIRAPQQRSYKKCKRDYMLHYHPCSTCILLGAATTARR
eukprot:530826-Amphidinium_carterae.1